MSCNHKNLIPAQNKEQHAQRKKKGKEVIDTFNPETIKDAKYLYVILKDKPKEIILTNAKNEENNYKMKHHVLAGDKNIIIKY